MGRELLRSYSTVRLFEPTELPKLRTYSLQVSGMQLGLQKLSQQTNDRSVTRIEHTTWAFHGSR